MQPIDIRLFKPSSQGLKLKSNFTHKVERGELHTDPGKIWFKKEVNDPAEAKREVLAQEFFRLLIPHQPETRLAWDPTTGVYYVLSEEVPGYRNLPNNEAWKFEQGLYQGMGQAMVAALWLTEVDFKNGNVGLDNHDPARVIKIDGDWCFAKMNGWKGPLNITPELINKLPYPNTKDFHPHNWLDLVMGKINYPTGNILSPRLTTSPQFRAEVNQALLRISVLPDKFIDDFVDAYMDAGASEFSDSLKERCKQLRLSALQNPSFVSYLGTQQASDDVDGIFQQIKSFQVNQQTLCPANKHEEIANGIESNIKHLMALKECDSLLKIIKTESKEDVRLIEASLQKNQESLEGLTKIKSNLEPKVCAIRKSKCEEWLNILKSRGINMDEMSARINTSSNDREELLKIQIELNVQLSAILVPQCFALLNRIKNKALEDIDYQMDNYCSNIKGIINQNLQNSNTLLSLLDTLSSVANSLNSEEVNGVIGVINTFRASAGNFTVGRLSKAQRIKDALYATPIDQRGTIITQNGPANEVQKAIASYRDIIRSRGVPLKGDMIDEEKSVLFKKLREQYRKALPVKTKEVTNTATETMNSTLGIIGENK